jgi:hypothetical protein
LGVAKSLNFSWHWRAFEFLSFPPLSNPTNEQEIFEWLETPFELKSGVRVPRLQNLTGLPTLFTDANHHSGASEHSQLRPELLERLRLFFAPYNRELNRVASEIFGAREPLLEEKPTLPLSAHALGEYVRPRVELGAKLPTAAPLDVPTSIVATKFPVGAAENSKDTTVGVGGAAAAAVVKQKYLLTEQQAVILREQTELKERLRTKEEN